MTEAAGPLSAPTVEFLADPAGSGCVWVYVESAAGATAADLEPLVNRYGLDPRAVLDCCERRTLPRAGEGRLASAVFLLPTLARMPDERSPAFGLFVGPDFVLTIHDGGARQLADLFRECQADPTAWRAAFKDGCPGLAAIVIERIVVQATRVATGIARRAGDVAASDARPVGDTDARTLATLRAEATKLAVVLAAERQVVGQLAAKLKVAEEPDGRVSASWSAIVGRLDELAGTARGTAESLDSALAVRGLTAAEGTLRATRFGAAVVTLTLPPLLALALFALSGAAARAQAFDIVLGAVAVCIVSGLYFFRRNGWM